MKLVYSIEALSHNMFMEISSLYGFKKVKGKKKNNFMQINLLNSTLLFFPY